MVRAGSTSNAVTCALDSSSKCPVLPPGAAQASRIRCAAMPFSNKGSQLRRRVLHRDPAVQKVRQLRDRHRALQTDRPLFQQLALRYRHPPALLVRLRRNLARWRAVSWRRHVCGLQNGFPVFWVILLQTLNPPHGMIPARNRVSVGLTHPMVLLTQEPTQTGVQERCVPRQGAERLAASTV